jgi:hypothetical protein
MPLQTRARRSPRCMHPQRPRQPPPEDAPSVQGPVYGSPSRHAGSVHTTVARGVLDISTPPPRAGAFQASILVSSMY